MAVVIRSFVIFVKIIKRPERDDYVLSFMMIPAANTTFSTILSEFITKYPGG